MSKMVKVKNRKVVYSGPLHLNMGDILLSGFLFYFQPTLVNTYAHDNCFHRILHNYGILKSFSRGRKKINT